MMYPIRVFNMMYPFCSNLVKALLLLTSGFSLRFVLFQSSTSAILVSAIHLMTCDTLVRPICLSREYRGIRSTHSVNPAILHVGMLSLSRPKLDSSKSDDMLWGLSPSFWRLTSLSRYWHMSVSRQRVLSPPESNALDANALHLAAASLASPSSLRICMMSSNSVSTSPSTEMSPAFLCINE